MGEKKKQYGYIHHKDKESSEKGNWFEDKYIDFGLSIIREKPTWEKKEKK